MTNLGIAPNITNTIPIDRIRQKQRQNRNEQDQKEKDQKPPQDKIEISGPVDQTTHQSTQAKKEKLAEDEQANPSGIGGMIDIKA